MLVINNYSKQAQFLCACLLFVFIVSAQINLVSNPSFEQHTVACNNIVIGGGGATFWSAGAYKPRFSYTYCNACAPQKTGCSVPLNTAGLCFQNAHSGVAYAGVLGIVYDGLTTDDNLRGYLQTKLIDSMQSKHQYYIEFYMNLNEAYVNATNNIGLLIGDTAIVSYNTKVSNANPQIQLFGNPIVKDTINWVRVAGIYSAFGGEQYITIGNFKDDAHTDTAYLPKGITYGAWYFIDDVSVIDLGSMQLNADAGRDTTINKGDSIWIGSRLCGLDNVQWYDSLGKPIATNVPGLWVKPAINSYYVITQTVNGYYSTDTVHVGVRQPLPVSVVSGQLLVVNEHTVKFSWVCVNEVNLLHYVVERSVDGRHYEGVGTVLASGASEYSFLDNGVVGGLYYRLRIVDRDGVVSYSRVFSLPLTSNNLPLIISPNPAKDVITVSGKGIGEVQVIDSWGKVVLTTKVANGHTTIDIKRLSGGVYVVKAFKSEGVVTGKFLKQ